MELIDRYLESVRWFLPSEGRDDILAELRDVLLNRREEKQAELGRAPTRSEDEALLLEFGNPVVVAARYGRQRYLIGPAVYPVFSLVLKLVLAVMAASAVIAAVVATIGSHGDAAHGLGMALAVAWNGAFVSIGIITVIFAGLERSGAFRRMTESWSVSDLPRTHVARRRVRRQTWVDWVAGIVGQSLFILWWIGLIHFWPSDIPAKTGGVMHFALTPQLAGLYWQVLALSAGVIAVNLAKLAGLGRRPAAAALDLALAIATIVVALLAMRIGALVAITGVGVAPTVLVQAQYGVDLGVHIALVVAVCGGAINAAISAWRLYRSSAAPVRTAANGA
ncbi:MAG TPA: hypothetical protein VGL58_19920 [Caulobacteraceae bacterium]|jgi:hypothetical protein